jgi:hypothetical protein
MTPPTLDLAAVVARLEKVERENRRLKFAGAVPFLLLTAVLVMGQAPPKGRTLEAEEFVLRDSAGTRLAVLDVTDGSPALSLLDRAGVTRAALQVFATGGVALDLSGSSE